MIPYMCIYQYMKGSIIPQLIINPGGLATAWQPFWLPDLTTVASPIQGATAIRHGMSISRRDARMLRQRGEKRIGSAQRGGRRGHGEAQLDPSPSKNGETMINIGEYMVISMVIM